MKNPTLILKAAFFYYLLINGVQMFAQSNAIAVNSNRHNSTAINANRISPQNTASRVTWLSFTATPLQTKVRLEWSTSTESNAKEFIVQRSTDSTTWNSIATVAASGNSASVQKYVYQDLTPSKGANYYRLLVVDLGDFRMYSRVVRTDVITKTRDVIVFPNPATDKIQFNGEDGAPVEIYNLSGDLMLRTSLNGNSDTDISQWQRGLYILRSGEQIVKLVVR